MPTPRQQQCLDGMGICVWRERDALIAEVEDASTGLALDQDGDRARSRPVPDGAIRSTASEGDSARHALEFDGETSVDHQSHGDLRARSVPDGEVHASAGEKMVLDQNGGRAHSRPGHDGAIRATAGEGDRARHDPEPGDEASPDHRSHGDMQARSVPDGEVRTRAVPAVNFDDWDGLIEAIHACEACELAQNCTQKVPGVGSREADLMIIGEGPGHDEDIRGEPFVGRSGQLLDRMLAAIGIAREQVYITNIVKCRPPNNRDPKPDEALKCRAFLEAQIRAIEPRVILSVGRVSAHNLLGTNAPVGKLIRELHTLPGTEIPVKVTYHPAYLLRNPSAKATAWQDLKQLHRMLK